MKRIKIIILNYILRNLFNTVTVDDILVYNPNTKEMRVGDKTLPAKDKQDIISGAESIRRMYVWEMLVKDIKYQSNKMIFENSSTIDDTLFGKAVLYTLDVIEKKLKNLSELR